MMLYMIKMPTFFYKTILTLLYLSNFAVRERPGNSFHQIEWAPSYIHERHQTSTPSLLLKVLENGEII